MFYSLFKSEEDLLVSQLISQEPSQPKKSSNSWNNIYDTLIVSFRSQNIGEYFLYGHC